MKQSHNFVIPFQISPTHFSVMVIMSEGSIERLKSYDPAEIVIGGLKGPWDKLKIQDVIIGFLTDEERNDLEKRARAGLIHPRDINKLIARQFKYRPDMGDHDHGPDYIRPNRG